MKSPPGHLLTLIAVMLLLSWPWQSGHAGEPLLYTAIQERLSLMKTVAAWKWQHDRPVEARAREAVVIEAARRDGLQYGLTIDSTGQFFSRQIEAAKTIQSCWIDRWQAGWAAPDQVPDLETVVRPALLALGRQITASLATAGILHR